MTAVTDFSRIFTSDAFLSEPVIVVAVSGGSDSTALLFRTKEIVSPATRLVAVTVDHDLRPGSAGEAAAVAALCAKHDIEHRRMLWDSEKPSTGIQAAARLARYTFLAKVAADLGGRLVLTGHTADDQAETISMRMRRGEGPGLAGIAPVTLYSRQVWFARPQLGQRRAALREELRTRGIGWIDDPSNENEAFERVRVRRELVGISVDDFDRLIETGARAATERTELGRRAAEMIIKYARSWALYTPTPNLSPQGGGGLGGNVAESPSPLWGEVRGGGVESSSTQTGGAEPMMVNSALLTEDSDAAVHALRILLAVVGGYEQLPDRQRTVALVQRLQTEKRGRFSLARTVVAKRKGEIVVTRERRGKAASHGDSAPAMQSPWQRLLPWFDIEPAYAVDQLLGKTRPPALPWP